MSNEEQIVKSLTGLGSKSREISSSIHARDSTISHPELYEKLLHHELFIIHEEAKKNHSQHPLQLLLHNKQPCILTKETPRRGVQMQIPPIPISQGVPNHDVLEKIIHCSAMTTL